MKILFITLGLAAFGATASATCPHPASVNIALAATDSVNLPEYAGKYTFATNGYFTTATIVVKDGALFSEVDSYGSNKLLPQKATDTFQSTSTYGSVYEFVRGADKRVTGLKLTIQGNTVEAKKE
jgi:hypothetical protein